MPTAKQQQSVQDGKELTLGALFLLDNAPDPPHDMEWHEYSEWAIAEHLSRHSYYYYPKSKRTLATAATIRKRVLEICKYNAKKPIQERQHGFKDKVAFVFEHGGTDLLKEDFLKREEYDKTTFSESRLSKYASEGNGSASTETDARPEIGKAKEDKGSDTSNTSSHAVGQQERLEGEADAAAPTFTQPTLPSPSSNSGTTPQPPDNSRAAPNPNIVDTRERREQNEAISDEQPQPSRSEGRQLRSSVGPPTQTLSTNNAPPCVIEKTNTTPSEDDIGPHNTSVLGAKRKRTQDQGPHKRQCQVSDATHQDDSRASKASQNAVISREKQHELQLATLNLDEQGWNMERLYTDILRATEVVLASIGQIRNIPSALQPDPSSQLRDLYARCWGPRWKQMCAHQTNQCFFRTPGVTTSLLSAFLCEKILTQRAGLEELVGNVVKIGGTLGEALLEEFDFSTRSECDSTLWHILWYTDMLQKPLSPRGHACSKLTKPAPGWHKTARLSNNN